MTVRDSQQHDDMPLREAETLRETPAKKPFVEPAISSPVDVLEATTFFQTVERGGSGFRRRTATLD